MRTSIDLNNPVINLCIEGAQAEFQGQIDEARSCNQKAWEGVQDDYDACMTAHFLARHQDHPKERLRRTMNFKYSKPPSYGRRGHR